jgi:UDP-N-acetyl-D-glucosamine dehydrogenase
VDALNDRDRSVRGTRVLVVGVSYKANVGDTRDSPALEIIETLQRKGARVDYYDPHVASLPIRGAVLESIDSAQADFSTWDVVLILTAHDRCDWKRITREARLVIDTRNATEDIQHCGNIIRL